MSVEDSAGLLWGCSRSLSEAHSCQGLRDSKSISHTSERRFVDVAAVDDGVFVNDDDVDVGVVDFVDVFDSVDVDAVAAKRRKRACSAVRLRTHSSRDCG